LRVLHVSEENPNHFHYVDEVGSALRLPQWHGGGKMCEAVDGGRDAADPLSVSKTTAKPLLAHLVRPSLRED
jgi:hypothetical protein